MDQTNKHPSSSHRQTVNDDGAFQHLIQNIKESAGKFKESLIDHEAWYPAIERQRQSLREQYLGLVFNSSKPSGQAVALQQSKLARQYSKDALNLIWLDTSYALINTYRQKINDIEQEIKLSATGSRSKNQKRNPSDRINGHPSNSGPVARRKLVQRFRSFLRTEDLFWKSLINRLIKEYHVDLAVGCLKVLKIFDHSPSDKHLEFDSTPNINLNQVNDQESSSEGILLVHKALICLGDLIRYGELYTRTAPRPPSSSARANKTPQKNLVVERDWSRSQDCYHQARLLIPTNGNPSNQLAVLSSYVPDILSSAYHYYRALCVSNPFPTARQNLGITYSKVLAKTIQANPHQHELVNANRASNSGASLSHFKTNFVALHAMLYTRAFNLFADLNVQICRDLGDYLKDRLLPPELILKMIVTCMAAVWYARVARSTQTRTANGKDPQATSATAHSYTTEVNATIHFLQFSTSLLAVAADELETIGDSAAIIDLSENISAILRRILPAMRIISKWVLSGHFEHINRMKHRLGRLKKVSLRSQLETSEADFWAQHSRMICGAKQHFPIDQLPSLDDSVNLEEDIELFGFLPLEKAKKIALSSNPSSQSPSFPIASEACHPNEEHLMRLGDLQKDHCLIEAKFFSFKPHHSAPKSQELPEDDIGKVEGPDRQGSIKTQLRHPSDPLESFGKTAISTADDVLDEYDQWVDDDDPVELAMRAVVAQQMKHDQGNATGTDNLESKATDHARNDDLILDKADNDAYGNNDNEDELDYLSAGPSQPVYDSKSSDNATGATSRSLLKSLDLKYLDQSRDSGSEQLSTAADLLASIMGKEMTNSAHVARSSIVTPPLPSSGFSLFPLAGQSPLAFPLPNPSVAFRAPRHGERTPSISLPKPSKISPRTNIWSHMPPSNSASPEPHGGMPNDWPALAAFTGTQS